MRDAEYGKSGDLSLASIKRRTCVSCVCAISTAVCHEYLNSLRELSAFLVRRRCGHDADDNDVRCSGIVSFAAAAAAATDADEAAGRFN